MKVLCLVLLALASLASCSTAPVEVKKFKTDAEVPRITVEDAKKDYDANNVVIVDSRPDSAYKQEHIAGSINIPIGSPDTEFDKLPKGKKIVVYCS